MVSVYLSLLMCLYVCACKNIKHLCCHCWRLRMTTSVIFAALHNYRHYFVLTSDISFIFCMFPSVTKIQVTTWFILTAFPVKCCGGAGANLSCHQAIGGVHCWHVCQSNRVLIYRDGKPFTPTDNSESSINPNMHAFGLEEAGGPGENPCRLRGGGHGNSTQ